MLFDVQHMYNHVTYVTAHNYLVESLALLGLEVELKTLQRQASHSFWNGCLSILLAEYLSLFNKTTIENTVKTV